MKKRIITAVFASLVLLSGAAAANAQSLGDVNSNGSIDIVDSLLVAQFYVGLNPSGFYAEYADVNCSSGADIVDALLIAQYYVGLIQSFPCSSTATPAQTATPAATPVPTSTGKDVFGITMMYPTLQGSKTWDALHWNNGHSRSLSYDIQDGIDPDDPTTWSEYRGDGTLLIDGLGVLFMGGGEPRIYINPYPGESETNPEMFFKNVEVTVYYMRTGSDGANWGGCVIGVRSGPNGHSSYGDYCDATTYYGRLRHDGKVDLEKELHHPESSVAVSKTYWGGSPTPSNQWIGVKFCVYNINNDTNVKLELYVDKTSGGANGGVWELAVSTTDSGSWTVDVPGCSYANNTIITTGGGVVMIRNTEAAEARYKMFSVREINVQQ